MDSEERLKEQPTVLGWRVWYDDLSVFDSPSMDWSDLPEDGLQVVMLYQSDGHQHILSGYDYYFRANGPEAPIYGGNSESEEAIKRRYQNPSIKRGRWTTLARIQLITQLATEAAVPWQ